MNFVDMEPDKNLESLKDFIKQHIDNNIDSFCFDNIDRCISVRLWIIDKKIEVIAVKSHGFDGNRD